MKQLPEYTLLCLYMQTWRIRMIQIRLWIKTQQLRYLCWYYGLEQR